MQIEVDFLRSESDDSIISFDRTIKLPFEYYIDERNVVHFLELTNSNGESLSNAPINRLFFVPLSLKSVTKKLTNNKRDDFYLYWKDGNVSTSWYNALTVVDLDLEKENLYSSFLNVC